jgi:exopolysaccharide production protein ExoZ
MWFYLCFASMMRYSGGKLAGTRLPCVLGAAVMVKMLLLPSVAWGLLNFLFHPLTLEFCAGCLLYYFRNHIGKVMIYGMAVAAMPLIYFAYRTPELSYDGTVMTYPVLGLHRALLWGGFAVCLVGVVTQIDLKYQWAWPRWLTLLGDASYSIYLIPGPFLMTFDIAMHGISKLAGHEVLVMTGLGRAAFWVAGSIICSILS